MGKQSLLSRLREWIGGIAFDVFLWSLCMTQDQYITAIERQYAETLHLCEHGYNGLCYKCDAMMTPPMTEERFDP